MSCKFGTRGKITQGFRKCNYFLDLTPWWPIYVHLASSGPLYVTTSENGHFLAYLWTLICPKSAPILLCTLVEWLLNLLGKEKNLTLPKMSVFDHWMSLHGRKMAMFDQSLTTPPSEKCIRKCELLATNIWAEIFYGFLGLVEFFAQCSLTLKIVERFLQNSPKVDVLVNLG